MASDPDRSGPTPGRARRTASRHWPSIEERHVWWLVVAALVADLALTRYGLARGLTEANPFGAAAFESLGIVGLGLLKAGAVGVAVVGRAVIPDRFAVLPPAVLASIWGSAATVNATVILAAT